MRNRTEQQPGLDRTRQFETPPPAPPPRTESGAPPPRVPAWAFEVMEVAPLVLAVVVGWLLLRRRRWRVLLVRLVLCLAGAIAASGGVFFATYLLGCRAMTCVDAAGLVPMLAGLGTGAVAGLVAVVVGWRVTARVGRRRDV